MPLSQQDALGVILMLFIILKAFSVSMPLSQQDALGVVYQRKQEKNINPSQCRSRSKMLSELLLMQ